MTQAKRRIILCIIEAIWIMFNLHCGLNQISLAKMLYSQPNWPFYPKITHNILSDESTFLELRFQIKQKTGKH